MNKQKNALIKMRPYLMVWTLTLLAFPLTHMIFPAGESSWYIGIGFTLILWPVVSFFASAAFAAKNGFHLLLPVLIWLIIIFVQELIPVLPAILSGHTDDFFHPIFRDTCLLLGVYAVISLAGMAIGRTAYPNGLFPNGLLNRKVKTVNADETFEEETD